jgi:hypothetical protein
MQITANDMSVLVDEDITERVGRDRSSEVLRQNDAG